jgi:ribosome-associated toxin RatA of RatAB toxin-antitoxin module
MTVVERSVLIHQDARRMRALVEDIAAYPEFLPWCSQAQIVSSGEGVTTAALTIDFHGIRQQFSTENRSDGPELIRMKLVSGPFRSLVGHWQFKALGPDASKVALRLDYEFSSRVLSAAIGPVFRQITSTLVEAFVARAESLYGTGGQALKNDAAE